MKTGGFRSLGSLALLLGHEYAFLRLIFSKNFPFPPLLKFSISQGETCKKLVLSLVAQIMNAAYSKPPPLKSS